MRVTCVSTGSKGNCYVVEDEDLNSLILDCGVPYKKVIPYATNVPEAALVTHCHGDHASHVKDFIKRGITVCAPHNVCAPLGRTSLSKCLEKRRNGKKITYTPIDIGHWHVQPFEVKHEARVETVGYLIVSKVEMKTLLYATDCHVLPPKVNFKFKSKDKVVNHPNDYMIIECNYDDDTLVKAITDSDDHGKAVAHQAYRHMGLTNLIRWLQDQDLSNLSTIYICHMSDRHANEDLVRDALIKATGKNIIIF